MNRDLTRDNARDGVGRDPRFIGYRIKLKGSWKDYWWTGRDWSMRPVTFTHKVQARLFYRRAKKLYPLARIRFVGAYRFLKTP